MPDLSTEASRARWEKRNPDGKVTGHGRDNKGTPVDYDKTHDSERISRSVNAILELF